MVCLLYGLFGFVLVFFFVHLCIQISFALTRPQSSLKVLEMELEKFLENLKQSQSNQS